MPDLAIRSLVEGWVLPAVFLIKHVNEGKDISHRVCESASGVWPEES